MKKKILKKENLSDEELLLNRWYWDFHAYCECFFKGGHIKNDYNQMHKDHFRSFNPNEKGRHIVIQAARGSAKTTMFALLDVLHRICYNTEKYILILSSTADLAKAKSTDIYNEVLDNERLRAFYKLSFTEKRPSKINFTVQSMFGRCMVKSMGFFSQIRGTKEGADRPSRMILDDVSNSEIVFSEASREREKRQFNTDIKSAGQPDTNIIFIGTPQHREDVISVTSDDATYEFKKYPAILQWPDMKLWETWASIFGDATKTREQRHKDADKFYKKNKREMNKGAKLLWKSREDLKFLMRERIRIGKRAFQAEKQLIPFLEGESLFKTIHYFDIVYQDDQMYYKLEDGNLIPRKNYFNKAYYALDPASGERAKSTSSKKLSESARLMGVFDNRHHILYVEGCKLDRKPPTDIIKEMFHRHANMNFTRMGVEYNKYDEMYSPAIKRYQEEYNQIHGTNLTLPIVPIYNKIKKEDRIYSLEPMITTGQIKFYSGLQESFKGQLEDYPFCDRNDGLDALEILVRISNPDNTVQTIDLGEY